VKLGVMYSGKELESETAKYKRYRLKEKALLVSTRPLSSGCLGLDLVKRTSSLFNSLATIWFTNSEPLSE
jgi:hypothetical protein